MTLLLSSIIEFLTFWRNLNNQKIVHNLLFSVDVGELLAVSIVNSPKNGGQH